MVALRFDAVSVIAQLFATGDGAAVQQLSDPTLDVEPASRASYEVARFLLAPA